MKQKILPFNLLRIILAFNVFMFHIISHFQVVLPRGLGLNAFFNMGSMMMVGFFMLSGFVLYYNYHDINFYKRYNIITYYKKRFISIYPVYFSFVVYVYITRYAFIKPDFKSYLAIPLELLGVQSFFPQFFNKLGNGGAWFISVLFFLYFLSPFLMYIVKHLIKRPFLALIFLYLITLYLPLLQATLGIYLYANPIYRVPEFFMGMILANLFIKNKDKAKNNCFSMLCLIIAILLYYISTCLLYHSSLFGVEVNTSSNYFNIINIPAFAYIIYRLAFFDNKSIITLCKGKVIQYLSDLSFTFYVTQSIALRIGRYLRANGYLGITATSYLRIFLIVLSTNLLLSIFAHELIEKPSKKYLSQILCK